jgi:mannose-1-phosphate guanylyltransferase
LFLDQTKTYRPTERAAIILAGGEGSRLRSLTRRIAGKEIPKQFCPIFGAETLLEQTLRRVALKIDPNLTSIVLNRSHERFYAPILAGMTPRGLVVQPQNRGTAPAILYPLLRLAEIAPQAAVAIFPSDHFIDDEPAFMRHVEMGFAAVAMRPELTVLLGIAPQSPETAYGWIEPGVAVAETSVLMVRRFWEKPRPDLAEELMGRGCLWNSFVIIGQLSTLLGLFLIALPDLYRTFKKIRAVVGTTFEASTIDRLYDDLHSTGFSEYVLATERPVNLAVLPVQGVNWSDLGEPRRVMEAVMRSGIRPLWAAA